MITELPLYSPRFYSNMFLVRKASGKWRPNSRLPQFMSPILESLALAVDSLSQDWQRWSIYMFPRFPLLNKVDQKLRAIQEAEVILIAHWWPSRPWFLHMLGLCSFHTAEICCHNRDRNSSRMESRTICMHEDSHATL